MMHQRARDPGPRILDSALLLAFLLPVFAWAPLTYPGYLVFRSGFLPVFNLVDRLAHLGDLGWLPRIGVNQAVLDGEGGLPYLLGGLPVALGVSPSNAVKWVFALSLIAASVGCYLWARQRLGGAWPALVAAALYVFNPISLQLVYTDGAYAETVLLALLPWVLWAADGAMAGGLGALIALALLLAVALWTQAGLALAFLLIVLVYLAVLRSALSLPPRRFIRPAIGVAGGLLLGGIGLIPALSRHGLATSDLGGLSWLVLLVPWIAQLGGWMAARLTGMLSDAEAGAKPALFAALLALPLLLVYGDLQPATSAGLVPDAPLAIFGENEIALLSVQTIGMPGPNGSVAVEVAWQALRRLSRDYTVFFHVIGGNDQRYGQLDTMPQGGKLPTTQWQPGEVVRDRYEAGLAPDAPIGDYRYWLGWYFNQTGERLTMRAGPDATPDDKYIIQP